MYAYFKTQIGKDNHEKSLKKWKEKAKKDPFRQLQIRARSKLAYAIITGKIKEQPCLVCGEKAQAHHPDYHNPLDVEWFCAKHHTVLHR